MFDSRRVSIATYQSCHHQAVIDAEVLELISRVEAQGDHDDADG